MYVCLSGFACEQNSRMLLVGIYFSICTHDKVNMLRFRGGFIFSLQFDCLCVFFCVCICLCVCPALLVNKIPASSECFLLEFVFLFLLTRSSDKSMGANDQGKQCGSTNGQPGVFSGAQFGSTQRMANRDVVVDHE